MRRGILQHDPEIIQAVKYCPLKLINGEYDKPQKIDFCKHCSRFREITHTEYGDKIRCAHEHYLHATRLYPIVNMWLCPHCNEPIYFYNYEHLRLCFIDKHKIEIDYEFKIAAINCNHKQKTREAKRRNAAIYRLYKNYNMAPAEIANRLNTRAELINRIIGSMFAHLCLNDESCIFKPYLQRGKH